MAAGLANSAVPAETLDDEVDRLARTLATKDPTALALGKRAFHAQAGMGLDAACAHANRAIVENALLPGTVAAMHAFLDRRRWAQLRRALRRAASSPAGRSA